MDCSEIWPDPGWASEGHGEQIKTAAFCLGPGCPSSYPAAGQWEWNIILHVRGSTGGKEPWKKESGHLCKRVTSCSDTSWECLRGDIMGRILSSYSSSLECK